MTAGGRVKFVRWLGGLVVATALVGEAGCVSIKPASVDAGGSGSGGAMVSSGSGGSGVTPTDGAGAGGSGGLSGTGACNPLCNDFPSTPIVDMGVPADAPGKFGAPGSGSAGTGPCLLDPQDGTLFPSNWLRPRFKFQAPAGQTLFELRLHSDRQQNDLVVYTSAQTWTMPKAMWQALSAHLVNSAISVTVRGLSTTAGATTVNVSAPSKFTIAPVGVTGSIVYWTTSGVSALKGFQVGDETVTPVLTPDMVGPTVRCIGCHVSTPDGQFIGLAANPAVYNADPSSLALRSGTTRMEPPYLTAAARQLLGRSYQPLAAFSGAHWKTGDRMVLSLLQNRNIIWTDLEAASADQDAGWGIIARTGDTGSPIAPTWSHDGQTIVYTSVTGSTDTGLRILGGRGSLYSVPYADRKGGEAKPLPGGNDPLFHAYYPAFAPDDRYLAFTRAPSAGTSYDIPAAEIFVLPRDGAPTPTRLLANDPPQCAKRPSPGVTNSWPKWAPAISNVDGQTYYWLTFSSRRSTTGLPQIFITAVTFSEVGGLQSYPALQVWNQPETEANHTPAWDKFEILVP